MYLKKSKRKIMERGKNKKMKNKVLNTIKKYNLIQENDKIVIGVSGGPDSMCLLNILNGLKEKLNFEIVVAHINHMIRKEAEEETQYVKNFCDKLGIKCYIKRIDVIDKSNKEKIGTEEAGRKARYDFFEEVLNIVNANKIATAHNENDNAETVLMNIFRGAGTSGLKGIEPIRDNKYIRPIIECERSEIEEYCRVNKLQPKIDKTNFENVYTRNKIRNVLIPEIKKEFNPNIIESLNKLSILSRQENNFIQEYAKNIMENELIVEKNLENLQQSRNEKQNNKICREQMEKEKIAKDKLQKEQMQKNQIEKEEIQGKQLQKEQISKEKTQNNKSIVLNLKKFNQLDDVIKNRIVLEAIQRVLGSTQGIEKIHVDDIVKLCSKNIGNKYLTPNKNIKVLVKDGNITFMLQ